MRTPGRSHRYRMCVVEMKQGPSGGESAQRAHVFRGHTNIIPSRVESSSGDMHTFITSDSVFELMLALYLNCTDRPRATTQDTTMMKCNMSAVLSIVSDVHVHHGDGRDGARTADASHCQHIHVFPLYKMAGRPRQQLSVRLVA